MHDAAAAVVLVWPSGNARRAGQRRPVRSKDRTMSGSTKKVSDRFIVAPSSVMRGVLSFRQWDDGLDKLSATKAKKALSMLLTDAGAEPGDEVEMWVTVTRKGDA